MEPQTPIGQLQASMAAGNSPLNQVSTASPNFQPSLLPAPNVPMPDKSPASLIRKNAAGLHHSALGRALQRRGLPIPKAVDSLPASGAPGAIPVPPVSALHSSASPAVQPPMPQGVAQQPNASGPQGGQVTMPTGQPSAMPASEAELIIKALSSRLNVLGKHESAVRDHLLPPKTEQP